MTPDEQVARYVDLANEERALKAELDVVSTERIALQAAILEHWGNNNITQQRVRGLTVYPQRQVYASAPKNAVEAAGLHDLIGVGSQSFSAWYREIIASGESIPEPLRDVITVSERTVLRTRRGS